MSLIVENLALNYQQKSVLSDISFALMAGEIACLLGQSGCGKTTALRCIAGFEQPNSGKIVLNNKILFDKQQSRNIPAHQRGIGMVFQDYALFPHLNVAQNIGFGLHQLSKSDSQKRVNELLDFIGLADYQKRYPHELSGGQQQRVALARALAPKPSLILLDEPFSSLDTELREHLSKEIRLLLKQQNTQAIVVTHDQQEAFAMADKIGMLANGVLQQWDIPKNLYHQPKTLTVAEFIGQGTLIDVKIINEQKQTALGNLGKDFVHFSDINKVLIRPEMVSIVNVADSPIHASILDIDFKGAYSLYQLQLNNGEKILVQSFNKSMAIGDKVGLMCG